MTAITIPAELGPGDETSIEEVSAFKDFSEATRHVTEQQIAALKLQVLEREVANALSSDYENRTYVLADDISDRAVRYAREALIRYHRLDPGCDMTLIISSPGGGVFAGYFLFDAVREISRMGHKVITHAQGWAASMGGVILQAGDVRVMGRETMLMIHEPASIAWGKLFEVKDEADLLDRMHKRTAEIYAERSVLSAEDIITKTSRRDWWLSAPEALELGFVDEVR